MEPELLVPPRPLLRSQREVDATYDVLALLSRALTELRIPHLLIAGSLLGAVRSASFLFTDDDADIAVFAEDYPRLLALLPARLAPAATFSRRPFPAADRVRPRACTQVWVDVFVLTRYDSPEELKAVLARKANGAAQAPGALEASLAPLLDAQYPLWHYDNRLALELWPREYLTGAELFPLTSRAFGHLALPAPAHAAPYLHRAYGPRCLHEWLLATQHAPHHKECAQRLAALALAPGPQPLQLAHYHPVRHSRHRAGAAAPLQAARAQLALVVAEEQREAGWDGAPGVEPSAWPASYPPPPLPPAAGAGGAGAGAGAGSASPRLGVALAAATAGAPTPFVFTPQLLAVLEPHVAKAREAREAGRRACALPAPLRLEAGGAYDARALPLAAALARALGVSSESSSSSSSSSSSGEECLARLHELVGAAGKHAATARLRDSAVREEFARLFDAFVGAVALPHLCAALEGSDGGSGSSGRVARVQAFPCLRLILPGEFSLGVHCDTAYGHHPRSLNFVLPLTPAGRQGSAGLYAESAPGREDWHGIGGGGEGSFARFHGGQCLHWAGENSTPWTRVSLDFRVLWGRGEEQAAAAAAAGEEQDDKYQRGGYYSEWREGEGGGVWVRQGPLLQPTELFGYPFLGVRAGPGVRGGSAE